MGERDVKLKSLEDWATLHIFNSFKVTEEEARKHAKGMLEFIEATGGDPAGFEQDDLIRPIDETLSTFLEWKSDIRKQDSEATRRDRIQRYNDYINLSKSIWDRKW